MFIWAERLTAEDKRGVNPLVTSNMTPYGEVKLNMTSRLALSDPTPRERPSSGRSTRSGDDAAVPAFAVG